MQHYCTLFNTLYLSRALVMLDSLVETGAEFHLYVFAFDDAVYDYFKGVGKNEHITVISLNEFEDRDLLRVKPGRTRGEYCWTCTPSTVLYCLHEFNLPACTYIDADLYFYADPKVLLDEMGCQSVLITEHRFTKEYEKGVENGIYCVQFVTFKNDTNGRAALEWWRDACITWCYARAEDGKFGDQKYLDDWTVRFKGIHVLKHLGGGLAPWNVQQYVFNEFNGNLSGIETRSGIQFSAIFFHFHAVRFFTDDTVSISNYPTPECAVDLLYVPYVARILEKEEALKRAFGDANVSARSVKNGDKPELWLVIQYYWQDVKMAIGYLLGKNVRKRNEAVNVYSEDYFRSID